MLNKKRLVIALSISALIMALVPIPRQTVPGLTLRITTQAGVPVANARVRQTWQNYSTESSGHEQDLSADAAGVIVLPERILYTSILGSAIGPARSFLSQGVHASYGRSSFILVYADGLSGWCEWKPGLPTTIEVHLEKRR